MTSSPRCTASRSRLLRARRAARKPARELGALGRRVDDAERQATGGQHRGVGVVADHEHAQRERGTARARQPLRAAPARQRAGADLGERHGRVRADHADVGRQHQLGTGADRGTVPDRDRGRRERGEQRGRIKQAARGGNARLVDAHAVGREDEQRSRLVRGGGFELAEQARCARSRCRQAGPVRAR